MRAKLRGLPRPRPEHFGFAMRLAYTGLAFLSTVLLARLLGPSDLGRYYEVVAWILLLTGLVQSGWAPFLVREIAALQETGRAAEMLGLAGLAVRVVSLLAVIAGLLLVAGAYIFGDPAMGLLYWLAVPVILLLATSTVRQAIVRGLGHPLLGQLCENLTRPGIQVLGLLLFWLGLASGRFGVTTALLLYLASIAGSAALAYVLQRSSMRALGHTAPPVTPPRSEWGSSLLTNSVTGWAAAVSQQVGTLVLASSAADAEIADFRIASQLALLLPLGLTVVNVVHAKEFSRLWVRQDIGAMRSLAGRTCAFSFLAALPLGLVFLVAGSPLLRLVFGPEFQGAFLPLLVLTVGQLANTFFGSVATICVASRNETAVLRAYVASAAVNVLLCAVLVPSLGALGASLAASSSLILWNGVLFVFIRRRLGITSFIGADRLAS